MAAVDDGDSIGAGGLLEVREKKVGAFAEAYDHGAGDADHGAKELRPSGPESKGDAFGPERDSDEEGGDGDEVEEVDGVGGAGDAQAAVVQPRGQQNSACIIWERNCDKYVCTRRRSKKSDQCTMYVRIMCVRTGQSRLYFIFDAKDMMCE